MHLIYYIYLNNVNDHLMQMIWYLSWILLYCLPKRILILLTLFFFFNFSLHQSCHDEEDDDGEEEVKSFEVRWIFLDLSFLTWKYCLIPSNWHLCFSLHGLSQLIVWRNCMPEARGTIWVLTFAEVKTKGHRIVK